MAVVASESFANDCLPIDYTQSSCLPPFEQQTDTNWCVAYSMADILSFSLCKPISASRIGLLSLEHWYNFADVSSMSISPEWAIRYSNKFGYCLEADNPSELIQKGNTFALMGIYKRIERQLRTLNSPSLPSACDSEALQIAGKLFPNASSAEDLANSLSDSPSPIYYLAERSCKGKINVQFNLLKCPGSAQEKMNFIDDQLKTAPVQFSAFGSLTPGIPWVIGHSVAIVGREWNEKTSTCEYIVRDHLNASVSPTTRISRDVMLQALKLDSTDCSALEKQ